MTKYFLLFSTVFLFFSTNSSAQSIVGSSFNQAGNGTVVLSYAHKNYTEFWAGTAKMTAPEEGLNQSIVSIYAQYAVSDKIEIAANLPYLRNSSKNDVQEFDGIQDISVFIKGKVYESKGFTGGIALGTNVATGYNPQALYSLGNGSSSVDGLALLNYRTPIGLSIEAQGGYSIRIHEDVPNAALFVTGLAYSNKYFYLKAAYGLQRSTDGIDIGSSSFEGPNDFPKTKVDYDQLTLSAYVPLVNGFALTGYAGTVINGRNMGDFSYFGLGVAMNWK